MPLREILYLDRPRIESYISQLAGGLTTHEVEATSETKKGGGGAAVDLKIAKVEGSRSNESGTSNTRTAVPAHAVLSRLEALLKEHRLVVDPSKETVLPGQIAHLRGDVTFESWSLLASLADSIQGLGDLGLKATATQRAGLVTKRDALEKRVRKSNGLDSDAQKQLSSTTTTLGLVAAIEGQYVADIKNLVKLFFQDQNHVRVTSGGRTFVGLLRRENLVGSTMEEMLFDYGASPKIAFDALFYVAEFGRDVDATMMQELGARITSSFVGREVSLAVVQDIIRAVGSAVLDLAEEVRRPIGPDAAFVVPLALFREVRPADAPATAAP